MKKKQTGKKTAALLVMVALWAVALASAPAQDNLLEDGGFEAYSEDSQGVWELRYGHKGKPEDEPNVMPNWKAVAAKNDATPERGQYIDIVKDGPAAGTVLIGQRITLPEDVSNLTLTVDYQCYCQIDNRSGMVGLNVFTPAAWDKNPKTPEEGAKRNASRGDIYGAWAREQGEDQLEWATGEADTAKLRQGLARFAGKEVVVAVSFLTWHQTNKEYARLDNLRLGPAK